MRQKINLNQQWYFLKNVATPPASIPEVQDRAQQLSLPHTWNALDGQDGGNDYFRGACCYLKQLALESLPIGDKYYLEICGANSSADVYLNGTHLAHHDGGYSTWRVELTSRLTGDDLLAIVVDNTPNDRVYPQMADFTFYGGLYRDVHLLAVHETHFDLDYYGGSGLKITPVVQEQDAMVTIEAFPVGLQAGDMLSFEILDGDGHPVVKYQGSEPAHTLQIPKVHLWNGKKDPYLYTLRASIHRGELDLDQIEIPFGCRSFSIDPEKGFILNGKEYPLRGVSRHQDRLGIGNALLPEHHLEDMELIQEMGATTIRLAHYQHDQYFYDLCDQYGMVIWAEIPYISQHLPTANENAVEQMKELIVQNYHHPSIVVWGLSNEITMNGAKDADMVATHHRLNDLVHQMDTTRLTTMACLSMCGMDEPYVQIPDVVSYNHYFGWYGGETSMNGPWFDRFHAKYPNKPIGVSEYGCEALNWHSSHPTQGDYTEEYQAYYHEELIKQLFTRPYLWATHVWNMFDFGADARAEGGESGQNHKGLVTMDRKYKKDAFYAYKAWLSGEPFVHLCGKRYIDRVEDVTKITVYSNQPEVELLVNGVSVGKQTSPEHFFYFQVENIGESTITAVAGNLRDEGVLRKVDRMNEDYILKEQGTVLNWFDVTELGGHFSLNDKLSDIMSTLRGKLWFVGLVLKLKKKMDEGKKDTSTEKKGGGFSMKGALSGGMLQMVGSFTVLRLTGLVTMINVRFTKEELLAMNAKLNRIKKKSTK